MTGVELIAAERLRQQTEEGFDAEHDQQHGFGELAAAAALYASDAASNIALQSFGRDPVKNPCPEEWPWDDRWWKPTPYKLQKQLAKAGALIAAAIDQYQQDGIPE